LTFYMYMFLFSFFAFFLVFTLLQLTALGQWRAHLCWMYAKKNNVKILVKQSCCKDSEMQKPLDISVHLLCALQLHW
jgi:hypothetical protein